MESAKVRKLIIHNIINNTKLITSKLIIKDLFLPQKQDQFSFEYEGKEYNGFAVVLKIGSNIIYFHLLLSRKL